MTDNSKWFDLYLFVVDNADHLIKLPHLTFKEASDYSEMWFEINDMHDYMLVTEGSTPWVDEPIIEVKDPSWISEEHYRLCEG